MPAKMRTLKDVKQDWNEFQWMRDVSKTWNHITEGMDESQKSMALYATAGFLLLGVVVNVWVLFGSKAKKVKNMKIQYSDKLILSPRAKTATNKEEKSKTSDGDSTMRGYKKTADGRTTTYFNRDSTPKPISSTSDATASSPGSAGGSAWNAAGTWEEKSYTSWATPHLRELLTSSSITVPAGSSTSKDVVKIVRVSTIEGDASVAVSRGKTRYVYDFTVTLEWKLQLGSVLSISGSAVVRDITPDTQNYEVEITTNNAMQGVSIVAKNGLEKYIKSKNDGLQLLLTQKFVRFFDDFQAQS